MSYVFESKRDMLYHKNYLTLSKTIEEAGGNGEFVIKEAGEKLLDVLARNQIELNCRYVGSVNNEKQISYS
jgi:hypothetical protein